MLKVVRKINLLSWSRRSRYCILCSEISRQTYTPHTHTRITQVAMEFCDIFIHIYRSDSNKQKKKMYYSWMDFGKCESVACGGGFFFIDL